MSNIKIVLVGGGTGGHFYPLIAIAEALNGHSLAPKLFYVGPEPYDTNALVSTNIKFVSVPAGKRRKYRSIRNYIDAVVSLVGIFVALCKLYIMYPDVIMSKGGYTSIPVIIAGIFFRIPIIIHESDSKIGSANKMVLRFARAVIVSYDEVIPLIHHPRVYQFGVPIRSIFFQDQTPDALESFGIDERIPLILVLGGSQGAERINQLILDSLDELLPRYTIIHQTGIHNYTICVQSADKLITDPELRSRYHPIAFLDASQLNNAYHLAQLVVSRAGSNSIFEVALHGKPSIIIPIPEEISHDQRSNAYAYARTGACVVMEERNFSDNLLQVEIDRIINDAPLYKGMSNAARSFGKSDAAKNIASLIIEIAERH